VPAKDDAAKRRTEPEEPAFRRPTAEDVRWAARRALGRSGRSFPSQAAMRRALLPVLRGRNPLFALGGKRMRALLVQAPGLRLRIRYGERTTRRPLSECPVCGDRLAPIRNQTLLGDAVTLGYRCRRCGYWTHLKRRVPVRYVFLPAGIDGSTAE
jgi:prepilin signal peptidase PulO-like enzyme (type II secretory pathway)